MLRRRRAWRLVGIFACSGILAVTTIAAVDHVQKTRALGRANLSAWYCEHRGVACGARKPDSIEDAWSRRERFYKGADICLIVVACVAIVAAQPWRR